MGRNNIFKLLEEKDNLSLSANIGRVRALYSGKFYFAYQINGANYTLKQFVNEFAFSSWKARNRCIDMDDFLQTIGFEYIEAGSQFMTEDYLTEIEVIYNFWNISCKYIDSHSDEFRCYDTRNELKNLMDACLSDFNYKAFYNAETEQLIVAEDKPEVTAVAEIVEPQIAFEIIRYNHWTLQGDFEAKKHILLTMAALLEPQRDKLKHINRSLEDGIFFMLNNLNLRHNNCAEGDKHYKKEVATMTPIKLEYWYDELYQMILLADLELDNINRMREIEGLKRKISGGNL